MGPFRTNKVTHETVITRKGGEKIGVATEHFGVPTGKMRAVQIIIGGRLYSLSISEATELLVATERALLAAEGHDPDSTEDIDG